MKVNIILCKYLETYIRVNIKLSTLSYVFKKNNKL